MTRYALLLRGINVGRHNRIAMVDLRRLLSDLGYTGVRTLLQSGNAVFADAEPEPAIVEGRIERAIAETFALQVRCLVRSRDQLRTVVTGNPFADVATDGSKLMALFLSQPPDPALLAAHDPIALDPGRVRIGDRMIYQWCPDGLMAAPPVGSHVEKHLAVGVTARNWNTVTRLAAMLDTDVATGPDPGPGSAPRSRPAAKPTR